MKHHLYFLTTTRLMLLVDFLLWYIFFISLIMWLKENMIKYRPVEDYYCFASLCSNLTLSEVEKKNESKDTPNEWTLLLYIQFLILEFRCYQDVHKWIIMVFQSLFHVYDQFFVVFLIYAASIHFFSSQFFFNFIIKST